MELKAEVSVFVLLSHYHSNAPSAFREALAVHSVGVKREIRCALLVSVKGQIEAALSGAERAHAQKLRFHGDLPRATSTSDSGLSRTQNQGHGRI